MVPRHYQNQCWIIVNWTLGNKVQWNWFQNTTIFMERNEFLYVVYKMGVIFLSLSMFTHRPLGDVMCNLKGMIFKHILLINILGISCKIAVRWMPLDLTDDWVTMVQIQKVHFKMTSAKCFPFLFQYIKTIFLNVLRPSWCHALYEGFHCLSKTWICLSNMICEIISIARGPQTRHRCLLVVANSALRPS